MNFGIQSKWNKLLIFEWNAKCIQIFEQIIESFCNFLPKISFIIFSIFFYDHQLIFFYKFQNFYLRRTKLTLFIPLKLWFGRIYQIFVLGNYKIKKLNNLRFVDDITATAIIIRKKNTDVEKADKEGGSESTKIN